MTDVQILNLAIFTATCGMGSGVIAYDGYARQKGLPSGTMFAADTSQIQVFAWIAIVGSLIAAPLMGTWWHIFVVLIGGNIIARALFSAFGAKVQPIVAGGTFVMLVLMGLRVWQA